MEFIALLQSKLKPSTKSEQRTFSRCPTCQQKCGHPAKSGVVTCPKCYRKFPSQPRLELREVVFFCSLSGQRFVVVFVRDLISRRFRIRASEDNAGSAMSSRLTALKRILSLAIGWKNRQTFNIDEFDFAGWKCLGCGHTQDAIRSHFCRCGKTGHLSCGASILSIDSDRKTFQCFPGCGSSGVISGRTQSMSGASATVVEKQTVASAPRSPELSSNASSGMLPASKK